MIVVKMLRAGIPINVDGEVIHPKIGDEVNVTDSVAESLVRGEDGEIVPPKADEQPVIEKEIKDLGPAPENKAESKSRRRSKKVVD